MLLSFIRRHDVNVTPEDMKKRLAKKKILSSKRSLITKRVSSVPFYVFSFSLLIEVQNRLSNDIVGFCHVAEYIFNYFIMSMFFLGFYLGFLFLLY